MNEGKSSAKFTDAEREIMDILRKKLQKKYNVIIVYVSSRNYWYLENYKEEFSDGVNNYFKSLNEVERFLKNN